MVDVSSAPEDTPTTPRVARFDKILDKLSAVESANTSFRQSLQLWLDGEDYHPDLSSYHSAMIERAKQIDAAAQAARDCQTLREIPIASFSSATPQIDAFITHGGIMVFLQKEGLVEQFWEADVSEVYDDDNSWRVFLFGENKHSYVYKYLPGKDGAGWEFKLTVRPSIFRPN